MFPHVNARGDDTQTAAILYRVRGIDPSGRTFTGLYTFDQACDLLRNRLNVLDGISSGTLLHSDRKQLDRN